MEKRNENKRYIAASNNLRSISHPLRLAVLCELTKGPRNVTELLSVTGVSQPNLSQHLAKLRMSGVVTNERRNQHVYYSIASPVITEVIKNLRSIYKLSIK
ncbi:MAG: metalloregulator ArsR/SmtB family transcription factor [Gammaproteobacteria bacterium]|nr:metalloregulator ArsR/SmtB family transcription factor [Gammaproteobacteria bacterium]